MKSPSHVQPPQNYTHTSHTHHTLSIPGQKPVCQEIESNLVPCLFTLLTLIVGVCGGLSPTDLLIVILKNGHQTHNKIAASNSLVLSPSILITCTMHMWQSRIEIDY